MSSAAPYPAVLVGRTGSAVPAARALTPSWLTQVVAGTHTSIEACNATSELHARGEMVIPNIWKRARLRGEGVCMSVRECQG